MEETVTIEKTSKRLKLHKALSIALILGGLFIGFTGTMSLTSVVVSLIILTIGLTWYFANRIQIWWNHG